MNHAELSSEATPDAVSIATDIDRQPGHGTILLVEDNTSLLKTTCEVLESAGYRVLKTRTAAEAICVFHQYKAIVRLLLTDVVLPGQNGQDLANYLRSVCPDLRTIFISGYPVVLMLATLLAINSRA